MLNSAPSSNVFCSAYICVCVCTWLCSTRSNYNYITFNLDLIKCITHSNNVKVKWQVLKRGFRHFGTLSLRFFLLPPRNTFKHKHIPRWHNLYPCVYRRYIFIISETLLKLSRKWYQYDTHTHTLCTNDSVDFNWIEIMSFQDSYPESENILWAHNRVCAAPCFGATYAASSTLLEHFCERGFRFYFRTRITVASWFCPN